MDNVKNFLDTYSSTDFAGFRLSFIYIIGARISVSRVFFPVKYLHPLIYVPSYLFNFLCAYKSLNGGFVVPVGSFNNWYI